MPDGTLKGDDVSVRFATAADLPEIDRAIVLATREMQHRFSTPDGRASISTAARFAIAEGQPVVIARAREQIVGWAIRAWYEMSPRGEVAGIGVWVHPDFRRRGISMAMTTMTDQRAKARGMTHLTGGVWKGNEAGLRRAEKDGWRVVGWLIQKDL